MFYYIIVTNIDNPILTDLSKRKLTIYESGWTNSQFLFQQYLYNVWNRQKEWIGQEIHSGCVETLKELETIVVKQFKFESFDTFYRLDKLKLRHDHTSTIYALSTIGRFRYIKVRIKRELHNHLAEHLTRALLMVTLLKRFYQKGGDINIPVLLDCIHPLCHITQSITIDDIDQIQYLYHIMLKSPFKESIIHGYYIL